MKQQRNVVILKIGDGNLDTTGFAFNLQVWYQGQERLNCDGRLPAAPAVRDRFEDWTETANNLGHAYLISLPTVQVTNVDIVDNCRAAAIAFEAAFNQWLMQGLVVNSLIVPLVQAMPQARGLKFFIQTSDPLLQRLPWQVWQFLSQTYPDAEVILSSSERPKAARLKLPVRILAIEGDTSGTMATLDLTPIALIPGMTITLLKQPSQNALRDHLWHESWDILLFMGHSRSQSRTGEIALNPAETLSLDDLHDALQFSVENGLKLAIFNSCDGIGIASKLADLKIPYTIAMRHRIPDVIAQVFLQTFLIAFAKGRSVHEAVYTARRKLQESQGRFPYAAWLPVIYQNPAALEICYPKPITIGPRWKYFLLSFPGLISAVMLTLLYRSLTPRIVAQAPNLELQHAQIYADRTSFGGQLLGHYNAADRAALQPALTAFAQQQYASASQQFQAFLQTHPESPEIAIYASNAIIRSGKVPAIGRVAASVPIGGNNPGTAEEMLRGMAQAQEELRQRRQPIEVMIVADSNGIAPDGTKLMPIIAPKIVQDKTISAVIGPNASDAARDAADLYDKGKLLMITPTAFFDAFSGMGNHVYRMLPAKTEFTTSLAQYAKTQDSNVNRVIVCEDDRSPDNQAIAEAFKGMLGRARITTLESCILPANVPITHLTAAFKTANAGMILISPHIEHMPDAVRVAQAAKRQGLKLIGTSTFFADNILSDPDTARSLEGMVLYTPWSPSKADRAEQNIFAKRWQTHVTWRTAMSYDTFRMIAAGLAGEFEPTGKTKRRELYNFFKQHQTIARHNGITGNIQFTEKGDRINHLPYGELLEIKQVSPDNWQFVPIPAASTTIAK